MPQSPKVDPDLLAGSKQICQYIDRDIKTFSIFMKENPDFPATKIGIGNGRWESSRAAISVWRQKKLLKAVSVSSGGDDLVALGMQIARTLQSRAGAQPVVIGVDPAEPGGDQSEEKIVMNIYFREQKK